MEDDLCYDIVAATDSQTEADMILEQLEEAGIGAWQLPRSQYPDQHPLSFDSDKEIVILVPKSFTSFARMMLGADGFQNWSEPMGMASF